jgi:hypothetical protein
MKTLEALGTEPPYLERYVSIRDSKHHVTRSALVAIHPLVTDRYEALSTAISDGTLHQLATSPAAQAAEGILRACYKISTKSLADLKAAILKAQKPRVLSRCPMCSTTRPGTHDHHMPSVKFPEFAVHGLNLVPCCATCNSIKDDDWLDEDGRRRFLHPFVDPIPDVIYLHVQLIAHPPLAAVGARFTIDQSGIPDPAWALVNAHYARLKLVERYNELASDEIETILSSCTSHVQAGGPDPAGFLTFEATKEVDVFGMSNWRAVLMGALAAHPSLPAWIDARLAIGV